MNIHTPRVDPLRLASATIQAVDRIGVVAAEEIDEPADERMRGAAEIAAKLPELAKGPVRCASLLAAMIMLCSSPTLLFAGDCVGQPNLQTAQEGHWYYRLDPLNHRKCWYLMRQRPSSESSAGESTSTVATAGTSTPLFSSLSAIWQGVTSARLQQDVAANVAAPTALRADPIAPKKSTSQPNDARVFDAERAARFIQLSTASRSTASRSVHADQQHQLDPSQREALFEKFLYWAAQQEHDP